MASSAGAEKLLSTVKQNKRKHTNLWSYFSFRKAIINYQSSPYFRNFSLGRLYRQLQSIVMFLFCPQRSTLHPVKGIQQIATQIVSLACL